MWTKTVAGVKKFLEKAFGSRREVIDEKKPNKKFKDKLAELPKERQEKIEAKVKELKKEDGLMRMSRKGQQMLTELEGVSVTKYKCSAGVWTIGIGATRTEYPDIGKWPMNKQITIQEAFDKLPKSLEKYERAVRRGLKVEVEQHVFDALVSWCYNVGVGWVKKASVIKLINKGVPTSSKRVYNALMMYKKPKEIIGRRTKEAKLLTTGKYTLTGKANLYKVTSRGFPRIAKRIKIEEYL
jgi:lysozyme